MSYQNLQFDEFLSEQIAMVYGPGYPGEVNESLLDHFVLNAHEMQVLVIVCALGKCVTRAALLAQKVKAPKACDFLLYGVSQRMQMLDVGCRRMFGVASLRRKMPLSGEEAKDLACDLNLIYVNIHGVMDNLCWAVLHEMSPAEAMSITPAKVGLFLKCMKGTPRLSPLNERIAIHDAWAKDFSSRRNPAAHRIPLSVPPQILTPDEGERWKAECGALWESLGRGDYREAGQINDRLETIGTFVACFRHDFDEGVASIYPTVPNDLGRMLTIFNEVESFLMSMVSGAP